MKHFLILKIELIKILIAHFILLVLDNKNKIKFVLCDKFYKIVKESFFMNFYYLLKCELEIYQHLHIPPQVRN